MSFAPRRLVPFLVPLAAALAAPAVLAQAKPPKPDEIAVVDAARYPSLAEVQAFLRNGSEQARHCAFTGAMFVEADQYLRTGKTEAATVEAMLAGSKGKLNAAQQARMKELAMNAAQMAVGLRALSIDSAPVAYTQICIASLRKSPQLVNEQLMIAKLDAARQCEKQFKGGSLEGKNCVAKVFRYD